MSVYKIKLIANEKLSSIVTIKDIFLSITVMFFLAFMIKCLF